MFDEDDPRSEFLEEFHYRLEREARVDGERDWIDKFGKVDGAMGCGFETDGWEGGGWRCRAEEDVGVFVLDDGEALVWSSLPSRKGKPLNQIMRSAIPPLPNLSETPLVIPTVIMVGRMCMIPLNAAPAPRKA
ncbi:unnamed protein product [Zymoseptoria tritici ST99CH_3D7]|uniref:Uncharacterized protein n=1 Tax=Zymoseptoria tritici (strain ST99CH_3D7) TaxID=1276538 RepID=A0A1X7S3K7_ZYMT9|nr:unnamed protein product [Zymoseptoria tritici ST99CH_3D7]